jgi:hypothetical protein
MSAGPSSSAGQDGGQSLGNGQPQSNGRKQMVSLEEVAEKNSQIQGGQNDGLRPPIDVLQKTKSGDEQ